MDEAPLSLRLRSSRPPYFSALPFVKSQVREMRVSGGTGGAGVVPIVSVFFGIVIRMYHLDHGPAHFHAEFRGQNAIFDLQGRLIDGDIRPGKVRRLVEIWARLHRFELEANWHRIRVGRSLERIEPLDRGDK